MSKKIFFGSVFSLTVLQFVNYASPLLTLPYLGRVLDVDGFGKLSIYLSVFTFLALIVDFGFNLAATPLVAEKVEDNVYVSETLSSVTFVRLAIGLICASLACFYSVHIGLLLLVHLIGQAFHAIWLFQGIQKMSYITKIVAIEKIFYIVLVFSLVDEKTDIMMVLTALAISSLFGGLVTIFFAYKLGYIMRAVSINDIKKHLKIGFSFVTSRLAVVAFSQFNVVLIGSTVGATQAGLYGSSEKLYQAGQSFSAPISGAMYPYLVKNKELKFFLRTIGILLCVLIVITCGCVFFAEEILTLFFGSSFSKAKNVFQVFMCILPIGFVSMNFGYPAFALLNKIQIANKTVIVGAVFHLLGLAILYAYNQINSMNVVCLLFFTESLICISRVVLFFVIKKSMNEVEV